MIEQPEYTEDNRPYGPRGGAEKFLYSHEEEILFEGPSGTGKTRAVCEKANMCALKYDGARIGFIRKTRASLTESAMITFEHKVIPQGDPMLEGASREFRRSYKYPNGSTIVLIGLDKVGRQLSTEYDMFCVFQAEELFKNDWETLTTRLRNGKMPYQQIIADVNPGPPSHWLNQRAYADDITRILSRHEDNPIYWNRNLGTWTKEGKSYIAKLDRLTGARKARLRHGIWAQQEGAVYETYDPAIHLIDQFKIPPEWPRYRVVDFGFTNPFVCQWWAVDPDGRLYLYREIYYRRRRVQTHADEINKLSKDEKIVDTICDHDAEGRATLQSNGISTIPARKAVLTGIELVEKRLTVQDDGKPRLFILRGACHETDPSLREDGIPASTEQEFPEYAYREKTSKNQQHEEPIKQNDHGMDSTRYMVQHLDGIGKNDFAFY